MCEWLGSWMVGNQPNQPTHPTNPTQPTMNLQQQLLHTFMAQYGAPPKLLARAPGRVNLIGEHTDYNDGFVLPMAIERAAWLALRPRDDEEVRLYALDFGETAVFSLTHLAKGQGWAEYVRGVVWALQQEGYALRGFEGVLASDVPIGAGLSSSAAVEVATARALTALNNLPWQPAQMARLCQRAENGWVGVNCGIMDQMISAAGQAGHALLIDCRSLTWDAAPLPPDTAVVILDTATRRGLVDSAYNERRTQCETAAALLGVPALRDISPELFATQEARLEPVTRRRARHVITENARTLAAAAALRAGDAAQMGQLMNASHASLRDDFGVSSAALNVMVDLAQRQPGCYGARMTGAGFGGCAVALVQAKEAARFAQAVAAAYAQATGLQPQLIVSQAAQGAEIVPLD